jgi:poly(A) polymerase Pap1
MTPQEALIQLSCLASYHEDEISSTDKSQSSMKVYRTELTQTIQTALERLPKVEELCELYQSLANNRGKVIEIALETFKSINIPKHIFDEIEKTYNEIKQLKEELKCIF